ncbi:MAG: hypothetical protein P9L99_04430 [Candidatus Lernaella stagnicola]|nr:hypothetical protein [Candidatus Lernaella stagnicola]
MAAPKKDPWNKWWIRFTLRLVRVLLRLPKPCGLAALSVIERLMRLTVESEADLAPIVEIKEIYRDDPKGREALRRMICEGRDTQIVSMVHGIIKHFGKPPSDPVDAYAGLNVEERHLAPDKARVAFLGEHYEYPFLRAAYAARGDLTVVEKDARPLALLSIVDAVEIAVAGPETLEWVDAALAKGVAVSLHAADASPQWLAGAMAKAKRYGTPLRVFYPYLFYPPVQRVKALIVEGAIGELGNLRVRATLGGKGGVRQLDPPFGDQPLLHPAFNHFALLTLWGGAGRNLTAYLRPMDGESGGQAVVAVEFAAAGRLGLLECTYAPHMHLRSAFYPHDLEAELCGTDGVIWLRRGMAARTPQAAVAVRVGAQAYTIGVGSGMNEQWEAVYQNAAAHLREMISGRTRQLIDNDALLSAQGLLAKTAEAATAAEVVNL